jgi:hypothetical protein
MRSPPIKGPGARLAFVPEGTQSVSVATAIGMKATNGLVDANSGLKPRGEV